MLDSLHRSLLVHLYCSHFKDAGHFVYQYGVPGVPLMTHFSVEGTGLARNGQKPVPVLILL